jgi:glycosyltransferase involved in cell wall biosynthesis
MPEITARCRISRRRRTLSICMGYDSDLLSCADEGLLGGVAVPLVIATALRPEGNTGIHTHVRQLRRYLDESGTVTTLVTPFSWGRTLAVPVFGVRLPLERFSRSASVAWYRHWHQMFLHNALRKRLADAGDCVIYAQDPLAAQAAIRARTGPRQRVVMAVHFRISQADEWADKKHIRRDGTVFRAIRQVEREVIPQVDGLVYVSKWAKDALLAWLPEAAVVPSAVIDNFVAPHPVTSSEPIGDLVTTGHLEPVKNHRFLLEILAAAKRDDRALSLDVYGEGPLRKNLERMARSLGVDDQVRFRGFRRDVRDFLPGYRAYVHSSYSESSSLAIIEAMAAGLPIVTANIGPMAELCDDGVEGRFWPLDDPAKAAAILLELLDNEPGRLRAGQAASARFRLDYDASLVGPRLEQFLSSMAPPAPREPRNSTVRPRLGLAMVRSSRNPR